MLSIPLASIDPEEAGNWQKEEMIWIEEYYLDTAEEVKAFYNKLLVHWGDLILSKDERDMPHNETLLLAQKITGNFASQVMWKGLDIHNQWGWFFNIQQVSALNFYHNINMAVVGFVVDESILPEQSTIAFTNSPIMAEMVKVLSLPLTQDATLAMRNLHNGISAFR